VVYVDKHRAAALWKAVRSDDLRTFLDSSVKGGEQLGDTTP
jgi:hypothetical protein